MPFILWRNEINNRRIEHATCYHIPFFFCAEANKVNDKIIPKTSSSKQADVMRLCVCAIPTSSHVRHAKHGTRFDLFSIPVYTGRRLPRWNHTNISETEIYRKRLAQKRPSECLRFFLWLKYIVVRYFLRCTANKCTQCLLRLQYINKYCIPNSTVQYQHEYIRRSQICTNYSYQKKKKRYKFF